ncbi:MAG: 50S ribosomal protein L9 [Actinobacteria bacterium]|nr:50S ribosomal protein L9 [Actinomycetota bacterium]
MRVLLRSDVEGLGRRGDVVDVANGYARNYLIPFHRAEIATPRVELKARAMRRVRELKEHRERDDALALAELLSAHQVRIEARAGTEGRLFGSVTASDIAEALKAQIGLEIDRRKVILDEPIKTLGSRLVRIHLHPEVDAEISVEVVSG